MSSKPIIDGFGREMEQTDDHSWLPISEYDPKVYGYRILAYWTLSDEMDTYADVYYNPHKDYFVTQLGGFIEGITVQPIAFQPHVKPPVRMFEDG
jgi:hypothetical protein